MQAAGDFGAGNLLHRLPFPINLTTALGPIPDIQTARTSSWRASDCLGSEMLAVTAGIQSKVAMGARSLPTESQVTFVVQTQYIFHLGSAKRATQVGYLAQAQASGFGGQQFISLFWLEITQADVPPIGFGPK